MYTLTETIDELRQFNVPEEVINRIMKRLLHAGAQSVYASMGEMCGKPYISQDELALALSTLMVRGERVKIG